MSVYNTALSPDHVFSKTTTSSTANSGNPSGILLITGHGVYNDCHAGPTVQHRSRLHIRPRPANLRQVHLQSIEELSRHEVDPAALGENVTTVGLDLGSIGEGWLLRFEMPDDRTNDALEDIQVDGETDEDLRTRIKECSKKYGATIRITGLRNPCPQIDKFRAGLKDRFLVRDDDRKIIGRKAGIMSVVEKGGRVKAGMKITVEKSDGGFKELQPV